MNLVLWHRGCSTLEIALLGVLGQWPMGREVPGLTAQSPPRAGHVCPASDKGEKLAASGLGVCESQYTGTCEDDIK